MSLSFETSVGTATPLISAATLASLSAERSATTTPLAPAAAYARATASPMPLAAPVTTQTLPFTFILVLLSLLVVDVLAVFPVAAQGPDTCIFGFAVCTVAPDRGHLPSLGSNIGRNSPTMQANYRTP